MIAALAPHNEPDMRGERLLERSAAATRLCRGYQGHARFDPPAALRAVISVRGYAHLHIIRGDLLRFFASPHAQKRDMHDGDKNCLLILREVFAVSLRKIAQRRFDSDDGVRLQIIRILCFVQCRPERDRASELAIPGIGIRAHTIGGNDE
jgi:hypothetical protein